CVLVFHMYVMYRYDCTCFLVCFFFFSSRRRHTRSDRDWSSDVCSSDLRDELRFSGHTLSAARAAPAELEFITPVTGAVRRPRRRSEERRVGKECRSRWSPDQ